MSIKSSASAEATICYPGAMCQSVPNRRGRAAAAKVIDFASAVADDGAKAARPQPSAALEEKKPSSSSSALNGTPARPLSGSPAERQPTSPPPFTIGELRRAIPARCFERSLLRSSLSLSLDLALAAALAAAALAGIHRIPASPFSAVRGLLWIAYWWLQGAVCTGIWVQAHECGHQAFSKYKKVNDGIGLVLHSLLLVRLLG